MKRILFTCLALGIWNICFSQKSLKKYSLVITNASIVDVENGKVVSNRLLAINGDTLQAIDDTRKASKYKAVKYVDAKGKFILPGLCDMHVHFRGGDTLINENKALLPLFLAYGVTTVRDAGGDITRAVLQWRRQIAAGEIAGPKIFTSGPKIDGHKASWPGSLKVETPDEVSRALDSLQNLGVDYVKIYDGSISREAYLSTIEQAQERGLKTTGHLPVTVKAAEAAQAGLDAIEHIVSVFVATSSREDSITHLAQSAYGTEKPINILSVLPSSYATYNEQSALTLFGMLAKSNTGVVPTLYVLNTVYAELKQSDHSNDSLLHYIDPKIQATYQGRVKAAKRQSDETTRLFKNLYLKYASMIPQMHAAGVMLLAGSDCGPYNSFIYPGYSLHEELKLMVAVGLTPAQALRTATINGAKFMGVENFYGTIQAGKSSDLIILDENPLDNIRAIDDINMIIAKGRLYSREDLNQLLQTIKH